MGANVWSFQYTAAVRKRLVTGVTVVVVGIGVATAVWHSGLILEADVPWGQ